MLADPRRRDFAAQGWSAEALPLDIADIAATESAPSQPAAPFDILVNSAGLARHGPALDTTPDDFDAVMDVNLRGAYFLAREVARTMPRGGSVITISSQMGHVGGPDRAVYCASKHAVEGMTKAMAIEWGGRGIRVNTICPTFIRTAADPSHLRRPRTPRLDREQDQARPRRRGRGHHGRRRSFSPPTPRP